MSKDEPKESVRTVLSSKFTSGPHGLGDPNDKSLRKVEKDVLIPKKMRDIARAEKCFEEVAHFTECCKASNVLMVVKCRKENSALKECLTRWYTDEGFQEHCKNLYLEERSQYRSTGIPRSSRLARIGTSM